MARSVSNKQRVLGGAAILAVSALLIVACSPSSGTPAPPTTTTSTLPWTPPTGAYFQFGMTCSFYAAGQWHSFPEIPSVYIDAPGTVEVGETFDIVLTPGEIYIPTVVSGFTMDHLRWMTIRYPLPDGVEWVDGIMTAGFDTGPGVPSIGVADDHIYYRVPGPFQPGATVQMPKVYLTFTATGAPGTLIQTKITNLSNTAQFGPAAVHNTCNPDIAGQIFTTTEIVAAP